MTEENVTRYLLAWLNRNYWEIISYDFPQGGTGTSLHPNIREGEKNKGLIIPDIIAIRGNICAFFENKDRIVVDDFYKVNELITTNDYSNSICNLLEGRDIEKIYYGIGIPTNKYNEKKINQIKHLSDFIVTVNNDRVASIKYQKDDIFD